MRKWILRRLTQNIGLKIISVALAFLLWFMVVGEPEVVAIQPVPLLYRNLPANFLFTSDAPYQVRAELRGPTGRLTRETLAEVVASLDLAGVTKPGSQTFTLSAADFTLPQGVTFLRTEPSQVSLSFDRGISKPVPVKIQTSGSLPAGYRLVAETVTPDRLEVSGPEDRVQGIESAKTDPVDLSTVTQTTDVKVNAFITQQRAQFTSQPLVVVHLVVEKAAKTEGIP